MRIDTFLSQCFYFILSQQAFQTKGKKREISWDRNQTGHNSSSVNVQLTLRPPACDALARRLSLVGELPGANVKSYAGYLTVNKKYNSNLFFWFFPALEVGCWSTSGSHLEGGEKDTSRGRDFRVNSTWFSLAFTFVLRSCVFFILQPHK